MKRNSPDDSKFGSKTSSNGKPYYNFKNTNGQIIGTSKMYENEVSRDHRIVFVK